MKINRHLLIFNKVALNSLIIWHVTSTFNPDRNRSYKHLPEVPVVVRASSSPCEQMKQTSSAIYSNKMFWFSSASDLSTVSSKLSTCHDWNSNRMDKRLNLSLKIWKVPPFARISSWHLILNHRLLVQTQVELKPHLKVFMKVFSENVLSGCIYSGVSECFYSQAKEFSRRFLLDELMGLIKSTQEPKWLSTNVVNPN